MDDRFVCRACRRGRCDQCEDESCACLSCGIEPVGEHGPELVHFRGNETVLKAGD
jgi:hypothetical protein